MTTVTQQHLAPVIRVLPMATWQCPSCGQHMRVLRDKLSAEEATEVMKQAHFSQCKAYQPNT